MQLLHDNEHLIHGFIEKCPSKEYWYMKYRTSWRKDCFYKTCVYDFKQHFVISLLAYHSPNQDSFMQGKLDAYLIVYTFC